MSGILFNNIPGSGLVAPLFGFEVNSGGQYSADQRIVILAPKTTAGTMALAQRYFVASQDDADRYAGAGSMLREMYRVARLNAPVTPIQLVALDDSGGTAGVWSISLASISNTSGVGTFEIDGEQIQINVGLTDTPTTIAAALAAAINAYYDTLTNKMLPVTATSSGAVVTLTSRNKCAIVSDLDIYVSSGISGNIFAGTGVFTSAVVTAPAGVPSLSAALAALGDDPADTIITPFADANSILAYGNATNDQNGRWAYFRQSYGHVWAPYTGSLSASTTFGLSLNDRHLSLIRRIPGTVSSAWAWVAGRAALESVWLFDCVTGNVSRNQTGRVVQGVRGPRDRTTLDNYAARNTLLGCGISTFSMRFDGAIMVDKTITTYRVGASGQPDTVFRDVQALYQVAGGLAFMRSEFATECGQKALADSNPGGLGAIVTPDDAKANFIHSYTTLGLRGVFQNADTFSTLLLVKINAENPDRLDAYLPMDRVNPLDILAANATIYQQYPQAA